MIRDHDTIAAPATAAGGALAVIRISGEEALRICDRIFRGRKPLAAAAGYTVHYGEIVDDGRVLDDVLVTVFRAPRSYTGEDAAEISCHGSQYIVSEILRLLTASGARMAGPGEFTIRAYLAGKLDLSQAEAVADIIASSSRAAHALAANQMRGGYSDALEGLCEKLLELTALLELELDFSEEEVEFADRAQLREAMQRIGAHIDALRNSFTLGNAIKEGVAVAITGAPNVGKSTLLKCIYRVLKPTGGAVYLDGKRLEGYSYKQSARQVAVLAQHNYYNFDFSVQDVVMMGRAPHKRALERDNARDYQIVAQALETVGMSAFAQRSFSTLSGGEQQRVILARALAQDTPCLILDEPTNHLDIKYQLQLMDIVKGLDRTVIAAIHDLNIAAMYCDRLYAVRNGTVVKAGTPGEVLTREFIREVYEVDAQVFHDPEGQLHILYRPGAQGSGQSGPGGGRPERQDPHHPHPQQAVPQAAEIRQTAKNRFRRDLSHRKRKAAVQAADLGGDEAAVPRCQRGGG